MRTNSSMAASSFPCRISFSALRSVTARSIGTACGQSSVVQSSVRQAESAIVLGQPSVNRIKQRRGPERSAVHLRVAESRDGLEVIGGGVALVAIETVAGIAAVQLAHLAVARHLGDNRG